jgi:hypothetical protein
VAHCCHCGLKLGETNNSLSGFNHCVVSLKTTVGLSTTTGTVPVPYRTAVLHIQLYGTVLYCTYIHVEPYRR